MDSAQVKTKAARRYTCLLFLLFSEVCVCGGEGIVMHGDLHAPGTVSTIILRVFPDAERKSTAEILF